MTDKIEQAIEVARAAMKKGEHPYHATREGLRVAFGDAVGQMVCDALGGGEAKEFHAVRDALGPVD